MEILSDATFKGNVTFNKDVSIGSSEKLLSVNNSSRSVSILKLSVSEFSIRSDGNGGAGIILNDQYLTKWSDLNSFLSFAPASLSTTVSSNTTKINSACSTISSLCTKVNSLCTTVASNTTKINSLCTKVDNIQQNTKHIFSNPTLPVGCTKFYFVDNLATHDGTNVGNSYYKFIMANDPTGTNTKVDLVSQVQVFKGGWFGPNEEIQMDIKQHRSGVTKWFEGILASNTAGYDESEILLVFDGFTDMCSETVPQ